MTETQKTVTIFGGTGFIGRYIVKDMAEKGWRIKVATRLPARGYFLRPFGDVGQIVPVYCDYDDEESLRQLISGSDYVVNCIGILAEKRKNQFHKIHTQLPGTIAKLCAEEGVSRFVHISALGVETSEADYARSKRAGEEAVRKAFPQATLIKPSVVFGPEDEFFNKFAAMSRYLPFLPLIGGGETKFQPVFVGDVAKAIVKCLTLSAQGEKSPCGKSYELGGPEVLSFKEIYGRLFDAIDRHRFLLPLPFPVAKMQAYAMKMLPVPPLTPDQVELLKTDNVLSDSAPGLKDLGIEPTAMGLIIKDYLELYRPGGRFAHKKRA